MLTTRPIQPGCPWWAQVETLAKEAFPPEEYLPPAQLARMAQDDHFDFLALEDGGHFVGFMAVQTYQDLAYLFFLAIAPACRAKGYGSQAIETLRALYPGKTQVVDFEMPDEAAANNHQRMKRRSFYLRNGYRPTGQFLSYLGVDYEVMCIGECFNLEAFKALMSGIRVDGFDPVYFTKV